MPPANPAGAELRFAEMGLILSAAIDGAGVALARSLLVQDALEDGRLIVPFVVDPLPSTKRHVARRPANRLDDKDIDAFVGWLVSETVHSRAGVAHSGQVSATIGPELS